MSKFIFELNSEGVRELLKSEEMEACLEEYAKRVQSKAGEGYTIDVYKGQKRANASIGTGTQRARQDNSKNNTLLKALGSAIGK